LSFRPSCASCGDARFRLPLPRLAGKRCPDQAGSNSGEGHTAEYLGLDDNLVNGKGPPGEGEEAADGDAHGDAYAPEGYVIIVIDVPFQARHLYGSPRPSVGHLFFLGCPAAINRLVVSIVVDALNAHTIRTLTHVEKEVSEIAPSITY
jgi:hypothetical protein